MMKLSSLNKKFGLNYKSANDFCFKFLKTAKINFNKYNNLSFNYHYKGDSIFIHPFYIKMTADKDILENTPEKSKITRRLCYFRKRYGLQEREMLQFSYQYRTIPQTRKLIEKAFGEFIRINRLKGIQSTHFQGVAFLSKIQEHIIQLYRETKMAEILPNGYHVIL